MAQDFSALAERRLLVVTGKGGAGKSLLSLAMAHRLSTEGRRVWLVEMGRKRDREFTRLPELLGKRALQHEPTEVELPGTRQRIAVSVLDPARSLSEYVDLKLPTGGLAGLLLNNRVTASFLEVVPGLPDLVQLGKIWHSLTQGRDFDTVVLDAPATGHAVALLKTPENFRKITRVGPIHRDAALMAEFLADPEKTGLVLAALPEEMAVQETLELQKTLGKEFPKPAVFVNKCFPSLPALDGPEDSVPWRAYRYAAARAEREGVAAAALKGARKLPFLFPEPGASPLYLRLSELLA
jgi:anion-transporting  ArsA/GET3 family ATPase